VNPQIWAAFLTIAAALCFNATFALLGKKFDYPDILRRPLGIAIRLGDALSTWLTEHPASRGAGFSCARLFDPVATR
jgi:hypothetical protein